MPLPGHNDTTPLRPEADCARAHCENLMQRKEAHLKFTHIAAADDLRAPMHFNHSALTAPALVVASLLFIALTPAAALGQEQAVAPSPQSISRAFGDAGLIAKFNSSEAYGAVQSRVGLYRSHISYSQATGATSGYRDNVSAIVAPINATLPLARISSKASLKLGAALISTRGGKGNLTRVDNDSINLVAEVLYPVADKMIVGFGLATDRGDTAFRHNGGEVKTSGKGLRFDYMYIRSPNLGLTARALYLDGNATTTVPTRIGTLVNDRRLDRLYVESNLVGSYRSADFGLIPDGWVFRPTLGGTVQINSLGAALDNLGKTYPHATERYAVMSLTTRLEKSDFRKGVISPYLEIGAEYELINNLDAFDSDPNNLYYKAGAATTLTGRERIDLYYAGRDGMDGQFHSGTINLLLSMSF